MNRPRGAFWGVMLAFLLHGLAVSTWISRLPSIKSALGLNDGALGLALLGMAIGSVGAIPVCGILVTRFGSRVAALWTSRGLALALVLPALAWSGPTLFIALFIYGAMAGSNDVAMNAQAVGTENLLGTRSISRFHGMFSLGGIVGSCVGGIAAAKGVSAPVHLLTGASLILALSTPLPFLLARFKTSARKAERLSLRNLPTTLIVLSTIGFCIFLSEGAIADWTAVYLRQILGASEGLAPMGYAVFSAAMAVFRFSGDAITMRLGSSRTIRYGALTAAAGLMAVALAPSTVVALFGFAAAGAGFSSIIPLVFAAGGRVESVSEGTGVATVSGLGYLGFLVGPPVIGFVSQFFSLRAGLFLLVLLSALAAALVGMLSAAAKRGTSSAVEREPRVELRSGLRWDAEREKKLIASSLRPDSPRF